MMSAACPPDVPRLPEPVGLVLTECERVGLIEHAARLRRLGVPVGTPADETSALRSAIEAIEARRGWWLLGRP